MYFDLPPHELPPFRPTGAAVVLVLMLAMAVVGCFTVVTWLIRLIFNA